MIVLVHIGCGGTIQRGYRHGKRRFCSRCKTDCIDMSGDEIMELDEADGEDGDAMPDEQDN